MIVPTSVRKTQELPPETLLIYSLFDPEEISQKLSKILNKSKTCSVLERRSKIVAEHEDRGPFAMYWSLVLVVFCVAYVKYVAGVLSLSPRVDTQEKQEHWEKETARLRGMVQQRMNLREFHEKGVRNERQKSET